MESLKYAAEWLLFKPHGPFYLSHAPAQLGDGMYTVAGEGVPRVAGGGDQYNPVYDGPGRV